MRLFTLVVVLLGVPFFDSKNSMQNRYPKVSKNDSKTEPKSEPKVRNLRKNGRPKWEFQKACKKV